MILKQTKAQRELVSTDGAVGYRSTALIVILVFGIIFAALSLVVFDLREAYACEVLSIPSVQDVYDNSAAVFTGKVIRIQNYTVERFGDWHLVSFEVDRYWKTANENADYDQIILFTSLDGNTCGYEFEVGKTYLVYAIKWWHDPNYLYTAIGYRNQLIEDAQEDLAFLGEGMAPTKQLSTGEQISRIQIEPLSKPHEEANSMVLPIVGIGASIAGVVAFLSLRRLKDKKR